MLLPTGHLTGDVFLRQPAANRGLDIGHQFVLVLARTADGALQGVIAPGPVVPEAKVFQFQAQTVDAEPVGNRGVDLQRLAGDPAAFFRRHDAECTHVVQAVGELDQDHADIARHGQHHLAEAGSLRLGAGLEIDLGELADTVDELGDLVIEMPGQLLLGHAGVFQHVV